MAQIMRDAGYTVLGTDSQLQPRRMGDFAADGAQAVINQSATDGVCRLMTEEVAVACQDVGLVVHSPAVPLDSPLLSEFRRRKTACVSLHDALNSAFRGRDQICVAGTHGKSSTSAMLAWILETAGMHPGAFVGAESIESQNRSRLGSGGQVVVESCEYSRSFHRLKPHGIILTGIERDHFDTFGSREEEDQAFAEFVSMLTAGGLLVVSAASNRAMAVSSGCSATVRTFGSDVATDGVVAVDGVVPDWTSGNVRQTRTGTVFECRFRGQRFADISLSVPGLHNVQNALAAIAMASELGCTATDCQRGMRTYAGIRRRFEVRGEHRGMTLVDDYAHHPTAIRATLESARQVFADRRIVAVFEPHQIVRTERLLGEFVDSLQGADEILVLPVLAAREQATWKARCRVSGELVRSINQSGGRAFLLANLDQVISKIDHSGRPDDVILTMGAGKANQIHDRFNRRLQRDFAA
jgi:UDP-N-acetylmuramate--alanine ligase